MVRWRTIQLSTSLSSFGTDLRFAMEISHQKVEESPASRWQWCWEPMRCPAVSVQLFAAVGVRYRRSGCSKGERCNKIRGKKKKLWIRSIEFLQSPHSKYCRHRNPSIRMSSLEQQSRLLLRQEVPCTCVCMCALISLLQSKQAQALLNTGKQNDAFVLF